eukprot:m.130869 g.130869  ORF g.130869 m.130869 type:complete len:99 (-) comp13062_c2_seq2:2267-2563(-)
MVVLRLKCCLVGDCGVGKSAVSQCFTSEGSHYPKQYALTTSVQMEKKAVHVPETDDSEIFLFDSPGSQALQEDTKPFVRECRVVVSKILHAFCRVFFN